MSEIETKDIERLIWQGENDANTRKERTMGKALKQLLSDNEHITEILTTAKLALLETEEECEALEARVSELEAGKEKRFQAFVAKMTESINGDSYWCRLQHPDTPEDAMPWDDWYHDLFTSKSKGRMEYEAARLNKLFNLPESKNDYVDILEFDTDLPEKASPQEPAPQWISVDDRLPEAYEKVLSWDGENVVLNVVKNKEKGYWLWVEMEDLKITKPITHWQPIAPPLG